MPAQPPEPRRAQAGDERHALEHDAERGAEAEQHQLGVVGLDAGQVAPCPAKRPNHNSTAMQTRLLTIGAQATATKRRWVLRSAVASAKKP